MYYAMIMAWYTIHRSLNIEIVNSVMQTLDCYEKYLLLYHLQTFCPKGDDLLYLEGTIAMASGESQTTEWVMNRLPSQTAIFVNVGSNCP